MSSTVGIGMIGCGGRLRGLARTLLADRTGLRVVALHDPSEASIRATREQCNPDAKVYDDYHALVQDPAVDWVMIGSWNCYHREQAIAAMEAGKDVFCEKPLATTLDDCIAMREVQQRTGKRFFIGFTLRYSPHYRRIKELIADGAVGRIVSMEFNETLTFNHGGYIHQDWRRWVKWAGTHLLEKCCHDIDIANWLTGSLAMRVASFGGQDFFVPEKAHHADRIGPHPQTGQAAYMAWPQCQESPFTAESDIIDNQVAILEYADKVRSTFHTNCNAARHERRNYIVGEEGTIRADAPSNRIELDRIGWDEPQVVYDTRGGGGHGGSDPKLTDALADCMLNDADPPTGIDEGFKAAITCFAIDEAMNQGTVVDLRSWWEKLGIEVAATANVE